MKLAKKICYIMVTIVVLLVQVSVPTKNDSVDAAAKTLRTMKAELAKLESELAANKKEQQEAESSISSSKKHIDQIAQEKVDIETEIKDLGKEITTLNREIVNMNDEIKDILNYYQLSNTGDSAALEYIFSADDYTEFIYRMAITEQLSDYNDATIKEYNKKIANNEQKKVELADKKVELNKKENELEESIKNQQGKLDTAMDGALDIEDEIGALNKTIKLYEETYKCKLDETLEECLRGKLPAGTSFFRPVVSGRVSSNFGPRSYILNGRWTSDFHYGIDFAGTHYSKIYSAANGQVAAIFPKRSCGGNMVYINHNINGKKYTTAYFHMASVTVRVGQNVTYETQIGTMGGTSAEYWDHCSTGSHLHFSVATGNWGDTYYSYSGHISKNINPRTVMNIPVLGKSFSSRTTRY